MTYKKLIKEAKKLGVSETFDFTVKGNESDSVFGKNNVYSFLKFSKLGEDDSKSIDDRNYSVRSKSNPWKSGMNVKRISKKYITLYGYNLFEVRSEVKLLIEDLILVKK